MSDWIFLRGLMREKRHWGEFVNQFEARMRGEHAYLVDFPGNGAMNHLCSPLTILEMVDACRSQVQQLGLSTPYRIVSISMGAMVAVQWANTYPNEVDSMVLINTSMRPFNWFYQRLRPGNYIPLLKLMLLGASAAQWERAILKMTSNHPGEQVLEYWEYLREHFPVSNANAMRQLWAAAKFLAPLKKPPAETLLLASERDQLVSTDCSKAIARRWKIPLQVHPTAGHDLSLDDGPWVIDQIQLWLTSSEYAR